MIKKVTLKREDALEKALSHAKNLKTRGLLVPVDADLTGEKESLKSIASFYAQFVSDSSFFNELLDSLKKEFPKFS